MTAAAMLAPLAEIAVADAVVFEQAQRSMALWPEWLAQLRDDSGEAVYHRRDGTIVVAHAPDRATLDQFKRVLHHKLPAEHRSRVQSLDGSALAQLEPALAGRFDSGLWLEGEGQLANDELMHALALAIDRLGGHWHECCAVDALDARGLHSAQGRCDADLVIWDPDAAWEVDGAALYHRHPLTPYAGRRLYGVVLETWLRGARVFGRDDGIIGPPQGRLLSR